MSLARANAIWARRLVDACLQAGVAHAFISPGSRNTPLLLALENAGVDSTIVVDERSAGFVALGYIRTMMRPAVVVCTSGSAPFHYGPAVAEADASCLPLVILSADRPARLRACGSMQTSLQANLFGDLLRASVDTPSPVHGEESLADVVSTFEALHGPYPGPVLINVQFEEPLWEPTLDIQSEQSGLELQRGAKASPYAKSDTLPEGFLTRERRGLITVGPPALGGRTYPAETEAVIVELAQRLGWPVLAEFHSGLRKAHPNILAYPDFCSRIVPKTVPEEPEFVLHFGLLPTSKNVQKFLHAARQVIHVDTRPGIRLPLRDNLATYRASPETLLSEVAECSERPLSPWLHHWLQTDRRVADALAEESFDTLFEPAVARAIQSRIEPDGILVVSNSMPIRQTDVWLGYQVGSGGTLVSRGVSGIDGTISAAIGAAIARKGPIWVFLGDLAFLHDCGALALVRQLGLPIRIIVSDNRGGGIFRRLPISGHPRVFESHFLTPQDRLDLREVAAGFGIDAQQVSSLAELHLALDASKVSEKATVIVATTDSEFDLLEERRLVTLMEEVAA